MVVLLGLLGAAECFAGKIQSSAEVKSACVAPEYHQFDFWLGNWDVYDIDNPKVQVAHAVVDRVLDGCVLLEKYDGSGGSRGESFSIYDASMKKWRQSWVTNRGQSLVIEGAFKGGAMVMSGKDRSLGAPTLVRGTWKSVHGGVRETAVRSIDDGRTWTPWFDLVFRPAITSGKRFPQAAP